MQDQRGDINPIPIVPLPLPLPLPLSLLGARSVTVPEIRNQDLSLVCLLVQRALARNITILLKVNFPSHHPR